ncbi:hypothetical protein DD607_34960, partial [Salmonella sp. 3DZ2-4SM]
MFRAQRTHQRPRSVRIDRGAVGCIQGRRAHRALLRACLPVPCAWPYGRWPCRLRTNHSRPIGPVLPIPLTPPPCRRPPR